MTTPDAELGAVVRRAASLLPAVARAVERCRTDPDPGQDLARACGSLVSRYGALREELSALPATALRDRVDRMLHLQQRIVAVASQLAFRPRSPRWPQLARSFGDGLTDSADELLALAARCSVAVGAGPEISDGPGRHGEYRPGP
jgi:hypothetical protein